jgi:glycosyltransferase involved in cell wall biosynthesis
VRIALIVPGGVSRDGEYKVIPALLWLIERLARRHSVEVVALRAEDRPASWEYRRARVHAMGPHHPHLNALRTVLGLHRVRPFDLFHAMWALGPGEVGLAAAALTRRPLLVHVAGGELSWMPEVAFGAAQRASARLRARLVLRHADRVTAASSPMLDLVRRAGAHPVRVPLGTDTSVWVPSPPRPRSPDRPARLVHVANLNLVKDQTTLLRAVAQLVGAGRSLRLDIVGYDALEGAMQRLTATLGIERFVRFHGFLPQRYVVPIVRAADLLVLTSRHEAGPVVVLEAAAVGVPTVGTIVGHLQDLAPDAAVTAQVADPGALAREIGRLLDDDERRLAVARKAQQFALREDADWTCGRFETLYTEVTRTRRLRRSGRVAGADPLSVQPSDPDHRSAP